MPKAKYQLPPRSLNDACATGDVKLLNLAIGGHPNGVDRVDEATGVGGLHVACTYGKEDIVATMIRDRGADVDIRSATGHTPLMCASRNGKESIVKMLIEAGADPALYNSELLTAEDYAAAMAHNRIVSYLRDGVAAPQLPAAEAAAKGNLHRLKKLRDADAFAPTAAEFHAAIDGLIAVRRGSRSATPEPPCVAGRHTAVIQWMLAVDATLAEAPLKEVTPLVRAVEADCHPLFELLLEHGVDPTAPSLRDGDAGMVEPPAPQAPVHIAKALERTDMARRLDVIATDAQYEALQQRKREGIEHSLRADWVANLRAVKKERERLREEARAAQAAEEAAAEAAAEAQKGGAPGDEAGA